jgi:toxin YoeB
MKVVFTESAWQDYLWFQEHNWPLLKRINDLIKDAQRSPFRGLGKPEPLKGELVRVLVTTDQHRASLGVRRV